MQEWVEFHAGVYFFPNWNEGLCFYHHGEQGLLWGSATPTPNTQTEELPVPPTQGKPSTGDKQVLLTHKTNKWSHFICVELASRQSIKTISGANFPFLPAPCKTSFKSWSTAVWKKTNTHIYSPEWKWLPWSWHFLLPPRTSQWKNPCTFISTNVTSTYFCTCDALRTFHKFKKKN